VLLAILGSGCAKHALPTQPASEVAAIDRVVQETTRHRRDGAAEVTGSTRSGALFALYRPADWSGDLVLYAHGYTPPTDPIHLPPIDDLREQLLARGFAVAYSSFSENGLAVRDGIRHTAGVEEIFASKLGRPRRIFLIGSSFGGIVAVALAERDPDHYSGLLTVSGLIGGTRGLIDYVAHVRVLFEVYYPGVLQGDLLHIPAGLNLNQHVVGPAVQAISANPQGAGIISQLVQTPVPFASGPELVGSIVQALGTHFVELEDLLQRTGGDPFFDNSSIVYSGALPAPVLADLNARVARYTATEDAQEFLERNYEPSGRLRIPMLTLYNTRDPEVNAFNETRYAARVALRGRAGLLEQRAFDRYGHTKLFTPEEIAQAFQELVARAPERRRGHDRDDDDRDRDRDRAIAAAGGVR
jgi:pimeloyl-ACP methyl ester carboxylesterase